MAIHVQCELDGDTHTLVLDTGASNTVVDMAALIILGYDMDDAIRTVAFETAKGDLTAHVFRVRELSALGITRRNVEICACDFINNDIFSDIHGVLGLDFFEGCKVCIDLCDCVISVTPKTATLAAVSPPPVHAENETAKAG